MNLCAKFAQGCNNSAGLQKAVKIGNSAVCKKLRGPAYFSSKINCAHAIIGNTRVRNTSRNFTLPFILIKALML